MTEKHHIRAAGEAAQNRAGVVCSDVLTSGTTGNPLVTIRSDREQRFIREFFTSQLRGAPEGRRLRGLEFANPYHGNLIQVPAPVHMHRVSVYDAGSFEYGRRILLDSHNDTATVDSQCSLLVGLERCLRAFTLDTIAQHPNGFPPTALRLVVSYSQYLTQAWRARLEETWGAAVMDRFGVSEIFGAANQCYGCGWWHFEPVVIPEVIGTTSNQLLAEGAGLLALTALYPFQQAQPLVRYLTGDLVQVTHESSCRPGLPAIKPLGRAQYGVPDPGTDDWIITPASILEAVDEIPEVARIPRFGDVEQVSDPYAIGHPRYQTRWSEDGGVVEVSVRLEASRTVPRTRRDQIAHQVLRDMTKRNPLLESRLDQKTVSISVNTCDRVEPDLVGQAHSGGVWSRA